MSGTCTTLFIRQAFIISYYYFIIMSQISDAGRSVIPTPVRADAASFSRVVSMICQWAQGVSSGRHASGYQRKESTGASGKPSWQMKTFVWDWVVGRVTHCFHWDFSQASGNFCCCYLSCSVVSSCFATPLDCSPPDSSVHGISHARILEGVANSFSRGSSPPTDRTWVSCLAGRFFTPKPPGKPPGNLGLCLVAQSCLTLRDTMDYSPPGSSVQGDSPGQNTGVGCHALLQGIFPTQGLNPGLPCCRQILYHLSYQESPRILVWVAYPFSRVSSQPRDWTQVSCIAGRLFTFRTTREAPGKVTSMALKWTISFWEKKHRVMLDPFMCFDIWVCVFWYTSLFNYDILKNFKEFYKCFFLI